jgi:hypothetical protein
MLMLLLSTYENHRKNYFTLLHNFALPVKFMFYVREAKIR